MSKEATKSITFGLLAYDSELDHLTLEGHVLQNGETIEIGIFNSWIAGQVARDAGGWYLNTFDQVGIRLQSGLLARMYEEPDQLLTNIQFAQEQEPHLLIVDDDPSLLHALSRTIALRLQEAIVDVAHSADEALRKVSNHPYDAVVSDIRMPGMSGIELLERLRNIRPEMPVLLITGHGEHDLAIKALRGGAYDYIQKPIERDNFIAALLRAIQTCQLQRRVAEQQRTLELHARSLERLVQQRTQELIEAYNTKDKVVHLVSNELSNPIVRLKEIVQLLHQKIPEIATTDIVSRSFVDIEHSLILIEELIGELQQTTQLKTNLFMPQCERCDLADLCHSILDEMASQNFEVNWWTNQESLEVEVDRDRIKHILQTLLSRTHTLAVSEEKVTLTLQRTQHEAIITLRDLREHAHPGSDFYVARKILERHGGHLEMQTFPEQRRTLFLSIPLSKTVYLHQPQKTPIIRPRICATATILYHTNVSHQ